MIYVFGMSHSINFLKAISEFDLNLSHENWTEFISTGNFFDLKIKKQYLIGEFIKAFVFTPKLKWKKLAEFTNNNNILQLSGSEEYLNLLNSIHNEFNSEKNILISFLNGNEHSVLSMVKNPRIFDFFLPNNNNIKFIDNAQPIDHLVISRQMELNLLNTIACLTLTRKILPETRIIHVMPPPPISSEERLKKNPEIFKDHFIKFGVSPLSLRLKYYYLQFEILNKYFLPLEIELLKAPSESISEDGAILEEYEYLATHANEKYGELIARQISKLIN